MLLCLYPLQLCIFFPISFFLSFTFDYFSAIVIIEPISKITRCKKRTTNCPRLTFLHFSPLLFSSSSPFVFPPSSSLLSSCPFCPRFRSDRRATWVTLGPASRVSPDTQGQRARKGSEDLPCQGSTGVQGQRECQGRTGSRGVLAPWGDLAMT